MQRLLTAYIADVTDAGQRSRAFGKLSACVGLGFIAGPALGGVLGSIGIRAPFIAAAVFNGLNLAWVVFTLPETRKRHAWRGLNWKPFVPFDWISSVPGIIPLLGTFIFIGLVGQIGGTIWVLYAGDRFHWDTLTIGFSVAGLGFFQAVSQGFLAGPISERWGGRMTVVIGILAKSLGYALISTISVGWAGFALIPIICFGGISSPALHSLLSNKIRNDEQGRLNGLLSSLGSILSVISPVAIVSIYMHTQKTCPGAIWLFGAILNLMCLPILFNKRYCVGDTPNPP